MTSRYDAIVLAGGGGSRMAGQAKPQLAIGTATMLDRVLAAVDTASIRIVVGPSQPVPEGVLLVQERPAGAGPVAAMAAGLDHVRADVVVVVAADLPFLTFEVIASLVGTLREDKAADAAVLVDENGRDQNLLGAWRVRPLRAALAEHALPGRAMRELVAAIRVHRVQPSAPPYRPTPWTDVDTPADLDRARGQANAHPPPALSPEKVRSGGPQK